MDNKVNRNNELINKLIINDFNTLGNKSRFKVCTIYLIKNKINGKVYIGQTISSPLKRGSEHFTDAKNRGRRTYFQLAIIKYGGENFEKYVIGQYVCKSIHEDVTFILNTRERYFIKLFCSNNREFGYNSTDGGDTGCSYYVADQVKTTFDRNGRTQRAKPCLQFDLDYKFIREGTSAAEASRELLISDTQIRDCCDRNQNTCKGFIGVGKDDYTNDYFTRYNIKTNVVSSEKAVLQYNFIGELVKEGHSASEPAILYGWDKSSVSGAANGKHKQAKGYIGIYKKDFSEECLSTKLKAVREISTYNDGLDKTLPSDIAEANKIYKEGKLKIKIPKKKVSELTAEQHEALKEKDRARYKAFIESMTSEELEAFRESEKIRHKKLYEKRKETQTEEEHELEKQKKREWYANQSDESKKKLLEKANKRAKNRYYEMSEEERKLKSAESRKRKKEKFESLSFEEQQAIRAKQAEYARNYRLRKKLELQEKINYETISTN